MTTVCGGKCAMRWYSAARSRPSVNSSANRPVQIVAKGWIWRFNAWSASPLPIVTTICRVSGNNSSACSRVPRKSALTLCCSSRRPAGGLACGVSELTHRMGAPGATSRSSLSAYASAGCCSAMIRSIGWAWYCRRSRARCNWREAASMSRFRFSDSTMMSSPLMPAAVMVATKVRLNRSIPARPKL